MARNKHRGISLSFVALARVFGLLRTSLYQPFATPLAGSSGAPYENEAPNGDGPRTPPVAIAVPLRKAKIILFPGALSSSGSPEQTSLAGRSLLARSDAWYSRAVAKSMPHRPFPATYV
jgi:hypothetical protein